MVEVQLARYSTTIDACTTPQNKINYFFLVHMEGLRRPGKYFPFQIIFSVNIFGMASNSGPKFLQHSGRHDE